MYSLLDLAVDISIRCCKVGKIVVLDDIIGHVGNLESHVFVSGHGGVEVEILCVNCHILCIKSADGAVNEELDCH